VAIIERVAAHQGWLLRGVPLQCNGKNAGAMQCTGSSIHLEMFMMSYHSIIIHGSNFWGAGR
jgi:hypothetical protein